MAPVHSVMCQTCLLESLFGKKGGSMMLLNFILVLLLYFNDFASFLLLVSYMEGVDAGVTQTIYVHCVILR